MWSDYPREGEALGQDMSSRDWFIGVSKNWEPYVTGLYQRISNDQHRVVVVATPILRDKKPIGVIALHYQLETLATWLRKIRVGGNGYVTVLDSKGAVLVHPNLDLQAKQYDDYAALEPVKDALNGTARIANFADPFTHEMMVASFVPVQFAGTRWVVVAQQPMAAGLCADRDASHGRSPWGRLWPSRFWRSRPAWRWGRSV